DSDSGCRRRDDLRAVIKEVSKGVVDSTDAEYKRCVSLCHFLNVNGFELEPEGTWESLRTCRIRVTSILAWIMSCCDDVGLDGKPRDPNTTADSYNHAQKMRAACTYGYGRLHGLGSVPWQKSEYSGNMIGNPSISEDVSIYMVSLRKKKVRNGEVATSARAITPDVLAALYHFNNRPEVSEIKPITRRKRSEPVDPNQWGGGRSRLMLHAVYVIAFLCLLRFDEALKIQVHDIRRINDSCFELTLPFRKTSQYGEIKPFVLHEFPPEQAHLCPVRALSAWLACSRITKGYLFPTITVRDQIGDSIRPMV
ncbi:hypothetical protein R3P38DRAFT_2587439, partial [Favolaschia claudopus]